VDGVRIQRLTPVGGRWLTDDVVITRDGKGILTWDLRTPDLPPVYIDVGDLDIFRDEDIAYAQNLARAGVPVELHVHPGVPHGWERFAPESRSAKQAMADRARVIASL
jgi:acetyl esterase/lipase